MIELEILENPDIFYFINWRDFKPKRKTPYISLAKKEIVQNKGLTRFCLIDFIKLLDANWEFKKEDIQIKLLKTEEIVNDVRLSLTQCLVWERRSINSNGKGRKAIPCILAFNFISKEDYEVMK